MSGDDKLMAGAGVLIIVLTAFLCYLMGACGPDYYSECSKIIYASNGDMACVIDTTQDNTTKEAQ